MTHQITTYNNSSNQSLPLREARRVFILFLMMVLGMGNAWADKWDGTVAAKFASGSGTQADPYIISNAAELAYFGSQMNGKTWYVELAADIDLNNREWTYGKNSATIFKGHFNGEHDGVKHTITNLKIVPTSTKNNGLFSSLQGSSTSRAEVKDLIIDGVTISQTSDLAKTTTSGALAGNVTEYTDIANVTVKNVSITFANLTGENFVGGFVGRVQQNNCKLIGCSVVSPTINITGNISGGASYIGGAIGQFAGSANQLSTLDGLTVASPKVTIDLISQADCYIGAVFGRINTYSDVKNVTIDSPQLTYTNSASTTVSMYLGSLTGGIAGTAAKETSVSGVTVNNTAQLTLGTEGSSNTIRFIRAGLIGMATTNVRLEDWTVADSKVLVNVELTNASSTNRHIGAFAGNLTGTSNAPLIANNISVNSSTLSVKANISAASYLGGFAGYVTTNVQLGKCTVNSPKVNIEEDINTGASYIGGAIGDFIGGAGNISAINGLTVENSSVTIDKVSIKDCCIGGVFGRIGNYSIVNGVTAKSPSVTYNNDGSPNFALNIGSFAGYILGSAQQETVVTGTKVEGTAQVTIDDEANEATNIITNIRAGLNGQVSTNVRLDDWTLANTSVKANGNLGTATSYIGGFAGYLLSGGNAPLNISNIKISGNSNVDISGNIAVDNCYLGGFAGDIYNNNTNYAPIKIDQASIEGTSTVHIGGTAQKKTYMGGFAGYIYGTSKVGSAITANNVTLKNADVSIDGSTAAECRYGAMVGGATTGCNFNGWEVQNSAKVTIGDDITSTCYIGGGFGSLEGAANYPAIATDINIAGLDISLNSDLSTTLYVGGVAGQLTACATTPNKIEKAQTSGKISITGSHTFANSNKTYALGGIVGYTGQSATNMSEINQCISEVNFDLSGLTPATAGNLYQNGLVVGGVIGRINTPGRLPEQLYYSGKIYAPYAAVGPIVGVFLTNMGAAGYVYNDYAGINASNVTNEWAKAGTWFYNGYKIGLTSDVMSQSVNYTGTPVKDDNVSYLFVGECATTFSQQNKIGTDTKNSYTVLSYDHDNNKEESGAIYPQWNKSVNTYPAYYMYYMQGVNRGTYTSTPTETKKAILAGTLTFMTLVDANGDLTIPANRGFVSHKLTAKTSASVSIDSYNWYVNGEQKQTGTSNTFNYTPDIAVNTVAVEAITGGKVVKRLECKVMPVFRVQYASAAVGTSTNPYLIGSAQDLQLLSYLSTQPSGAAWEKDYDSYTHYNKAYYKMDGNVDLSAIDDFAPIGLNKATYSQNYIFDGVFDGNRHTISGLKETWYGGIWNTDDYNVGWGLFAYVGNPNATIKVGDTSASNTVIKNLIIDGATLTHDPNNTSFYYNSGTSGKTNNCMVGVLAGIVTGNTTIQNIEIRNSKITDEDSSNYNLATRGLYVGGAIGSVQNAFNATANVPANIKIDHIAAQVDITLEHPTFADATKEAQLGLFNIGGIIGRYCATSALQDQAQASMPAYTLYSGSVTASKAWISPVLGATRFTGQNDVSKFANYSKVWEGNNNSAATQLTITNAQHYNFRINGELMTELYPKDACARGVRPIAEHIDATEAIGTYNAAKYQGVNYNARFIDSDGTTLYYMNQSNTNSIYWVWDNGFPHMTDQKPNDSYLTRVVNDFTANMVSGSGSSYRWQVSYDGETWTEVDGLTQQTSSILSSARRKLVVAIITVGGTDYRTQAELVEAEELHFAPYIRQTGDDASGYVLTIVWNGEEPSGILSSTYQWYHSDKTSAFGGETNSTINLTKTQLDAETGGLVWCAVTIREMGEEVITIFVKNTANVVYVNGNGYTGNSAGVGNDANDGRTPQTPVKTIDKANSLLDGGPWDKNIIVVMGTLNSDGVFCSTGTNSATLTGKWDGTDYEGVIKIKKRAPDKASGSGQGAEDDLNTANIPGKKGTHCYVFADTKFEHLTFEGNNEDNAFIECHGHDITFGKGLIMTIFRRLSKAHGNFDGAQVVPELTIILTATNLPEADIAKYTNRTKPQVITFQSGHYGRIMGGRYTNAFFAKPENTSHSILGSAEHPIWAVVNIDIDPYNSNKGVVTKNDDGKPQVTDGYTCDINSVIAGLTDGSMYGDFTINYHGGNVSYIVGGNQGNPVPNGTLDFKPDGGVLGNSSAKKVAWGQWPNATYFGRTVINVEQDPDLKTIRVGSLYAGGLGRQANGSSAKSIVDMYFYGHTEVNVKSGTVDNVYGGGAGGVMGINPWDAHLPYATTAADNANSAIMNKVQYGDKRYGSWSSMVKGTSPFAKVTLHDLNDAGTGYDVKELDLSSSYTTLNISGGTINGSVYGGGYGYVADMPCEVALQGIGSVFGTSNINITGGTITGSVYGGSQGDDQFYGLKNNYGQTITHIAEMNGTVNLTITCDDVSNPPTIGGNVYGAGKGIASASATQEYLSIATAGNADLGDQYKTDINITIDMPASIEFPNDIYGGGALGKVDGNTNIILKQGKFTGNIYGGGYGELNHKDKAMVTGTTNIYTGAVDPEDPEDANRSLLVSVKPSESDATKKPTIYGGGNMAQVTGNTYINIWHGNITADVFGGGRGLSEAESKGYSGYGWVNGNTRVLYNNTTDGNKLTGNIYGGGALGAVVGTGDDKYKGTTVVIKAGEVDGDVFGGGKGEEGSEKAKVTGNTNVIVDSEWTEPTPEPELQP